MEKFNYYLDYVSRRHGVSRAFNDFLTICVCALSAQTQEDLYFQTIKAYDKNELQYLANAFSSLVMQMDNRGEGLTDCLGGYFEEHISSGKMGQFFTPEPICDLMAQMTHPKFATISDPACGSGRNLLAAAKINRYSIFYGADICLQCCQMTLINMCLNGLFGWVHWMDTIKQTVFGAWRIAPHEVNGCPFIEVVPIEEAKQIATIKEEPKPQVLTPQLSLFESNLSKYDLY